ncbi:MAG TPA: hypothetical protein VK698_09340 [Kofleriaceae bacterium]|nr:hypothetical protein [Kofleriaceae bacterium]
MHPWIERAALVTATALTALTFLMVPSWRGALADPCHHAAIAAAITIAILWATRRLGRRGVAIERQVMAAFLIGMPLIYIARWLLTGGGHGADGGPLWLGIELLGLPLYAGLALAGLRRSPWFLVAGIAAHGLAWDSWHLASAYIPAWYAIACLIVDVGMALYVAARVPTWQQAARSRRATRPAHSRLPPGQPTEAG